MEKENRIIRIKDYSEIRKTRDRIIEILNNSGLSFCNTIGLSETIKQEIFLEEEEED